MRKYLKTICTLSLILNMVLIGIIGGHIYKRTQEKPYNEVSAALSPEMRAIVGQTFQETFSEVRNLGDGARLARGDLVEILSADEFDPVAYDMVAAQLNEVRSGMQSLKINAVRELALKLPVAERQALAERMAKMAGGWNHKRGKNYGPPKRERPTSPP